MPAPKVLLNEAMSLELGATEPWPNDVRLFQPLEVEQILLPDNANCLAVKAYLKMCELPFDVVYRKNAEFMSPNGQVPFIQCGQFIVSELENIVPFVNNKGVSLTDDLDKTTKLDMRAYMTLVNNILSFAELYITWVDKNTLQQITYVRNGCPYPWPLSTYQNYKKRNQIVRKLKAHGWYDLSLSEVLAKVEKCCSALSEKLGTNDYFFGNKLTEVDCMLYGHFFSILVTPLPYPASNLSRIVRRFKPLLRHCNLVERLCFNRETDLFNEGIADIYSHNRLMMRQILTSLKVNEIERQKRVIIIQEIKNSTTSAISDYLDDDNFEISSSIEAISMDDLVESASSAHMFSDLEGLPSDELPDDMVDGDCSDFEF